MEINNKIELKTFIENNHNIVNEFQMLNYNYTTSIARSNYDKICILFMNSLEAAGGSVSLDGKHTCFNNFKEITKSLVNNNEISFSEFARCFVADYTKPEDINKLVAELINNKELPQFKYKKANLFMKELVLHAGNEVFQDFNSQDYIKFLNVPIDAVIRKVYYKLINESFPMNNKNNHDNEKAKINDCNIKKLSEELFPDRPILLDDLWYWGHFVFIFDRKNREGPNYAMIETDRFIPYRSCKQELYHKFEEFIKIISPQQNA